MNSLLKGLFGPTVWISPDAEVSIIAGSALARLYGDVRGDPSSRPRLDGEMGVRGILAGGRERDLDVEGPAPVGDDARA